MTYNVFGGTLNLAQSKAQLLRNTTLCLIQARWLHGMTSSVKPKVYNVS